MTTVNLAWFSWGAVFGLYVVLAMLWSRQLRRLNPHQPRWANILLAVCWPYCEWKADR